MEGAIKDWRNDIYKVFKELDITMAVSYTHLTLPTSSRV